MLIVIEGIDGCGKGGQIDLLRSKFNCEIFKYPTRIYPMLNDYLEKKVSLDPKALFLLFLADIAEDQKNIKRALSEKKLVILDRYVFSTISYEVDGIKFEDGKKIITGVDYLKPDLVLLLDIDSQTSQKRKSKQKALDRYEENASYLEEVRSNYLKLFEQRFLTPNWHKIDACMDVQSVHKEILKALAPFV